MSKKKLPNPRLIVTEALASAAERFPDLPPMPLDTGGLSPADARLALAIYRTTLQRWMTLEFMLNRQLARPIKQSDPGLRACLLAGAAQLFFMDRLPVHAVVNESVNVAKQLLGRPDSSLVNSLLRRLHEQIVSVVRSEKWQPSRNTLPMEDGFVLLTHKCLPHPDNMLNHLSAVTSHPADLVKRWSKKHGWDTTRDMCFHSIRNAPTIVNVEPGFSLPEDTKLVMHASGDAVVWKGTRDDLIAFMAASDKRWVQDPTARLAVAATAIEPAKVVLDYCAGQGTKSRQAMSLHSGAKVYATDIDPGRTATMRESLGDIEAIDVVDFDNLTGQVKQGSVDLLMLDVPCSNTGVLARRPEAKYRFNDQTLDSLVNLQQEIVGEAMGYLAEGGRLLYSTCSIDEAENEQQVQWISEQYSLEVEVMQLTLPGGEDASDYRDGGFYTILRRK